MDIYCSKCGEPIDSYELHDVADADGVSYETVASNFRKDGCKALGYKCNTEPSRGHAVAAEAMYELLGDDMDGAATMLDDLDFLGMLD